MCFKLLTFFRYILKIFTTFTLFNETNEEMYNVRISLVNTSWKI